MNEYTIYRRKGFAVVPLIGGFQVKRGNETIYRFDAHEVDEAVEMVDDLAAGVGEKVA